jgi:hypothetical protein
MRHLRLVAISDPVIDVGQPLGKCLKVVCKLGAIDLWCDNVAFEPGQDLTVQAPAVNCATPSQTIERWAFADDEHGANRRSANARASDSESNRHFWRNTKARTKSRCASGRDAVGRSRLVNAANKI